MRYMDASAVVIGGGSGGYAALYRLARAGVDSVLVEQNPGFGGTSVFAGVNAWEPGVAFGTLHRLLYAALSRIPNGCAVSKTVDNCRFFGREGMDFASCPWGLSVPAGEGYEATLGRCLALTGGNDRRYRRLQFAPDAMQVAMTEVLAPYRRRVRTLFGAVYEGCRVQDGSIRSVTVRQGKETVCIRARMFVDASAEIVLARDAGCRTMLGTDGPETFGEEGSPAKDETQINGATLVFRFGQAADACHRDVLPSVPDCGRVISCFNQYPDGTYNVNMLPTLSGAQLQGLSEAAAYGAARNRVYALWHDLQQNHGLAGYRLQHLFPMLGRREGPRLLGRRVLTLTDVRAGLSGGHGQEEWIAMADHPLDIHDGKTGLRELAEPYGIPLSCLLPAECDNLVVACRGASFSHLAAASTRLSRTMLALGEAAGLYAAQCIQIGRVNVQAIRQEMGVPDFLRDYEAIVRRWQREM